LDAFEDIKDDEWDWVRDYIFDCGKLHKILAMCRPNNEEEVELIDKLGRASSD
jgi:hypothetical protein